MMFHLAQIECEVGGWSSQHPPPTPEQIGAAHRRWKARSHAHEARDAADPGCNPHQCGDCACFAKVGMDYGICWNESSPLDGCVTFEHGGCAAHSDLVGAE